MALCCVTSFLCFFLCIFLRFLVWTVGLGTKLEKLFQITKVKSLHINKFLNPIVYYYVGDRLFVFEQDLLVNVVIFNNNITKKPLATKINKSIRYIEAFWQRSAGGGIGHPQHLVQRLEASSNRDYYELAQLIK